MQSATRDLSEKDRGDRDLRDRDLSDRDLTDRDLSDRDPGGRDLSERYERDEADVDDRVFHPAAIVRAAPEPATLPFEVRNTYLIPLEPGQAVNESWPDVHHNRPRGVTWHWSAGATLAGLRGTLGGANAERRGQASAHYGIGRTYKEGVDRYVLLGNRSWHAGKNQLLRWDGQYVTSPDDKGCRSTIGIETVNTGYAGNGIKADSTWIDVCTADCCQALKVRPWTEEQIAMMVAIGREIQAAYPHLTYRDHHGHEDLCPAYKQDVAGFPFARVLRGIYRNDSIPDVWTPLRLVSARQRALSFLGYDLGDAGADGRWGKLSAAALSQFQRDHGLPEAPWWTTFVNWKVHEAILKRGARLEDVAQG